MLYHSTNKITYSLCRVYYEYQPAFVCFLKHGRCVCKIVVYFCTSMTNLCEGAILLITNSVTIPCKIKTSTCL